MIRRFGGQRSLFEAAVGPVEALLDAPLRQLDALLDDEELVTAVMQRQAQRWPQSRWRGRPGTPADVALRLLVLQRLRGWTFDETEREVRASLVYRWVTHIYLGRVPDAKTLIRLSQVIGEDGVRALHARIVRLAIPQAKVQGRRARIDTTVVETNMHYPTDSTLLTDGIRVLTRAMKRLEPVPHILRYRVRNRLRAARRRMWEIVRASRRRGQAGQAQLNASYRHLLALTRATVRDARRVLRALRPRARIAISAATARLLGRTRHVLRTFLPRVEQVIQQTRARLWHGDTHYREKLLSLFEPHTEVIRKGKAAKPTEFGHLVKLHEAERGLVVDYEVYARRPADKALLLPALRRHQDVFGRPPRLVAADAGFWSKTNRDAAEAAGVTRVCVPTTGRPSAAQRQIQHQRWFRRGLRWRTGCEGRISVLKRRDGLARCLYHGFDGTQRWVGWGVIAHNIHLLITPPR
jgi:IS5 family transposase